MGSGVGEKITMEKSNSKWDLSILDGTPPFSPFLEFNRPPDYGREQLKKMEGEGS